MENVKYATGKEKLQLQKYGFLKEQEKLLLMEKILKITLKDQITKCK